jgi:transcriptional regulator with XRE-family HTH domain
VNHPGNRLRILREQLGFTMRDVENISQRVAGKHKNEEYEIPVSRLSDIETKSIIPSMYRVYTLAVIYRQDFCEILSWYGIDLENIPKDLSISEPPRTHRIEAVGNAMNIPLKMDPSFDLRKTTNVGRMIEQWGVVSLAELQKLPLEHFTYGYIGTDDFTMYPLIMPGSFVQVDEKRNEVVEGVWRTEYERPIYFVETREGYTCTWVTIKGEAIILQPHPLSPAQIRVLRHEREAEVIGQVVGIAMRLDRHEVPQRAPEPKALSKSN